MNVAVVELALPQSSVAVNVTVADPVAPSNRHHRQQSRCSRSRRRKRRSLAPPLLASQSFNSVMLPMPNSSQQSLKPSYQAMGSSCPHRERRCRRAGVAAVVSRSERHRMILSRRTVAQGNKVAPGNTAANVRSCSSAVVGEPVVQLRHCPCRRTLL